MEKQKKSSLNTGNKSPPKTTKINQKLKLTMEISRPKSKNKMNNEIKEKLFSIMAISERYKDCDACALINEKVSQMLKKDKEDLKDS